MLNGHRVINGTDEYMADMELLPISVATGKPLETDKGVFNLTLYGHKVKVTPIWLRAYIQLDIILPEGYEEEINNICFYPINLRSHGVKKDFVAVYRKPVYHKQFHSFRLTPMYNRVAVSNTGEYLVLKTGKVHGNKSTVDGSYTTITGGSTSNGEPIIVLKHRLVALAWVPNDNFLQKPIVGHKDGDKSNCYYRNLEWVSFAENNRRANHQGLKTDSIDVKVKDYHIGKVYIFPSVTEATRFMHVGRINNVADYCERRILIKNRYQIKLLSDDSPWDYDSEIYRYKVTVGNEMYEYHTLRELAKDLLEKDSDKLSQDKVKQLLRSKYGDDITISFPKPVNMPKSTYEILNVKTGEQFSSDVRKDMEKWSGLSKTLIQKLIGLGPTASRSGFSIREKSDAPWPKIADTDGLRNTGVKITSVLNGKEKVFGSLRQAGIHLKCDKKTVKQAIENKSLIKNYKVSYIKEAN